jgi:hypothetical protein
MIDVKYYRNRASLEYENQIDTIDVIEKHGLLEVVYHIRVLDAWSEPFNSIKEGLKSFRCLGKHDLDGYFLSGSRLRVAYKYNEHNIVIHLDVPLTELTKLNNGKCRIVETTQSKTEIVCDLDN